jgi:hypothetical protein
MAATTEMRDGSGRDLARGRIRFLLESRLLKHRGQLLSLGIAPPVLCHRLREFLTLLLFSTTKRQEAASTRSTERWPLKAITSRR